MNKEFYGEEIFMKKTKLFCLPYAGGSAMMYYRWKNQLEKHIEVIPLELPGRGKRTGEPLISNLEEIVDLLFHEIISQLDRSEVAFFGYSMGSLLAFELAYRVETICKQEISHLFLAASRPPHLKRNSPPIHMLPQEEFEENIYKLGGTPRELFENEEVRRYFLPLLRSDFKLVETYNFSKKSEKLSSGMTILMGMDDIHNDKDLNEWSIHTNNSCKVCYFNGGHFFINEQTEEIIKVINNTLPQFSIYR
ncbi:hypothetical protein COL63_21870 [Bacillus pseudomycoides]|nr:hypothetical protein COL63_21870 [Bacillus pseudomycoides]